MKTEKEIRDEIADLEDVNRHVLKGSLATIQIDAPKALQQLAIESKLRMLYWVLGEKYVSKLKGVNT